MYVKNKTQRDNEEFAQKHFLPGFSFQDLSLFEIPHSASVIAVCTLLIDEVMSLLVSFRLFPVLLKPYNSFV